MRSDDSRPGSHAMYSTSTSALVHLSAEQQAPKHLLGHGRSLHQDRVTVSAAWMLSIYAHHLLKPTRKLLTVVCKVAPACIVALHALCCRGWPRRSTTCRIRIFAELATPNHSHAKPSALHSLTCAGNRTSSPSNSSTLKPISDRRYQYERPCKWQAADHSTLQ